MRPVCSVLGPCLLLVLAHSAYAVTVYHQKGQHPFATTSSLAPGATYSGPAAYNPTTLVPPPAPTDLPLQYNLQVQDGPAPPGASIPLLSSFFGFSIEMSVVDQVLGHSSDLINVPFLNLMANLVKRSGRVNVRVGGNTQETAALVDNTANGKLLQKDYNHTLGTTNSPPLTVKKDLLVIMRKISDFVNVRWFLGIPFNDTAPFRLDIAEEGQAVLGDYLIGLQAGNEPDFYAQFGKRLPTYSEFDYFNDVGNLITQLNNDQKVTNRTMLLAPSVASGPWAPERIWNTGFIDAYSANLAYLAVEHYPTDNCAAQFGSGVARSAQDLLPTYLTHDAGINLVANYLNSSSIAQQKGKPFVMFETNTASCGGFGGLSDAFTASLWGVDYALQMAYVNFSMAMFHVGGQNVFYNPFTAPPTNQSHFHQWTVGPIYYSALVMAETLGNSSQVLDMTYVNNNINHQTPAYVIYENGKPARIALFNYVTDPSGAHDVNVTISIGGQATGQSNATPAQVTVKYLRAQSVATKGNITWAGQTFGSYFESDGRPMGQESIQTVQCDQSNNACTIPVYAPSFALVFLSDDSLKEVESGPYTTYSTTAVTKSHNTATVDPSVLATSNGHGGFDKQRLGSTSKGSLSGAAGQTQALQGATVLATMAITALTLLRGLSWWP
ncbi:hypothetical protein AX17_003816 [Amanita inopinata Kibby_2008]|nr:hypothetical protein AX17_003816 [Amanita inopinata Kibby_2008]